MKKYYSAIITFLIILILFSCSSDDNESVKIFTNIEGTVNGPVSCNTDGKGPAYGIVPHNFDLSSGFIITASLPDEFKQEGLTISFDMKLSKKYITICTANFSAEQFYEFINVRNLNNQQ